jgi:hypothetical protein
MQRETAPVAGTLIPPRDRKESWNTPAFVVTDAAVSEGSPGNTMDSPVTTS